LRTLTLMGTHPCYLDPETGALSSDPRSGAAYVIEDTVPGVRAPLVLRCGLHRRYETVDTVVSIFATDPGLTHAAGLVRSALAATCTTCGEWRIAVHKFQAALGSLRSSRAADGLLQDDRLLLPIRSYLAIGQALNSPKPLPEALATLAGMTLPSDPPALPVGATAHIDRGTGAIAVRLPGQRPPAGSRLLQQGPGWCLMRCAKHGWENVAILAPPDGKTLAIAKGLGRTLLGQGAQTCEEYVMTRGVMDAELDVGFVSNKPQTAVPPLEAFRSYRGIAATLSRTTRDIGYVVARALEEMAAGGW